MLTFFKPINLTISIQFLKILEIQFQKLKKKKENDKKNELKFINS